MTRTWPRWWRSAGERCGFEITTDRWWNPSGLCADKVRRTSLVDKIVSQEFGAIRQMLRESLFDICDTQSDKLRKAFSETKRVLAS